MSKGPFNSPFNNSRPVDSRRDFFLLAGSCVSHVGLATNGTWTAEMELYLEEVPGCSTEGNVPWREKIALHGFRSSRDEGNREAKRDYLGAVCQSDTQERDLGLSHLTSSHDHMIDRGL